MHSPDEQIGRTPSPKDYSPRTDRPKQRDSSGITKLSKVTPGLALPNRFPEPLIKHDSGKKSGTNNFRDNFDTLDMSRTCATTNSFGFILQNFVRRFTSGPVRLDRKR